MHSFTAQVAGEAWQEDETEHEEVKEQFAPPDDRGRLSSIRPSHSTLHEEQEGFKFTMNHTLKLVANLQRFSRCGGIWKFLTTTLLIVVLLFYYYVVENQNAEGWSPFFYYLVVKCGVAVLGVVLLLHRRSLVGLATVAQSEGSSSETSGLLLRTEHASKSSTQNDPALAAHTVVFFVATLLSWASDYLVAEVREVVGSVTAFAVLGMLQNFFHSVGFLVAAVSYRLLSIHIWTLYHGLEEEHQGGDFELSQLLSTLSDAVASYENTYRVAEQVSARTSKAVALMILLLAAEISATLGKVFRDFDYANMRDTAPLLCSLVALGALLIQVALAAADLVHASETLAGVLATMETSLQVVVGEDAKQQANICRSFGSRVRHHPIRMRFPLLYLNIEWVVGLYAFVLVIVLAIVSIHWWLRP